MSSTISANSSKPATRGPLLDLGAVTPHDGPRSATSPLKELSGAYDAEGNFILAKRAERADKHDCRICDEPAKDPVRAQCCNGLFCREHIRDWIKGPGASPSCPACAEPCVLPEGAI
ncbi:hypothetical protein FB45DRAFT_1060137 [Roridomyces roridus]|uniref:RING-type domain-containing protein n=1 Tax=Roridomyces roridus TaxID=1738132 RepID=A0AAD7BQF8_9AGAR|nr:hypothetical protein FB45DRAFT_1060137 [Roridomyces roridus]